MSCGNAGVDPGFDQGGAPDRDRPKTAILGPQFCRILVLGPHFWWSGGGGLGPQAPPWIRPCFYSFCNKNYVLWSLGALSERNVGTMSKLHYNLPNLYDYGATIIE